MTTPAEQALIEKVLAGDDRAFDALIKPHLNKMRHLLGGYFKHSGEAEEALQEALIRAWKGLGNFRAESKFSTWLYTVTSNTARNVLDKNRRHYNTLDLDELNCSTECLHEPDTMADRLDAIKRLDQVKKVLASLPPQIAEALILREVKQMTDEEIAEVQNCPRSTVRSRIWRARNALKLAELDAA